MSALPPEADIAWYSSSVRFVPLATCQIKRMTSVTAGLKRAAEMGPNSVIRTYKAPDDHSVAFN